MLWVYSELSRCYLRGCNPDVLRVTVARATNHADMTQMFFVLLSGVPGWFHKNARFEWRWPPDRRAWRVLRYLPLERYFVRCFEHPKRQCSHWPHATVMLVPNG